MAMRKLASQRPENLIIVAEMGDYGRAMENVLGADIYVHNSKLGMGGGSSLSTAVISAYAAELFANGMSQKQVIETILNSTDLHSYTIKGERSVLKVFNPQLLKTR